MRTGMEVGTETGIAAEKRGYALSLPTREPECQIRTGNSPFGLKRQVQREVFTAPHDGRVAAVASFDADAAEANRRLAVAVSTVVFEVRLPPRADTDSVA